MKVLNPLIRKCNRVWKRMGVPEEFRAEMMDGWDKYNIDIKLITEEHIEEATKRYFDNKNKNTILL